ncbi:MAG TPA: glycolate oxidase subunit GlcE [Thermohalobaculum sp.]|nr:glycolate oxidase subunit GlcE [Thermohalobaculum sp.]
MASELRPADEAELAEAVAEAAARRTPLEIRGGGTRAGLGRPVQAERTLSTAGLIGITLYEPGALTLVVRAGTPLREVEETLAAEGQMLPFEPMDHRPLLRTEGEPTIGGMVACGVSGPRRIQAGACRDAMIGVRFVDGEGHVTANGGRVMKNVTGYDLVKLMAGSYGTLGVVTEVAFKLLPRPPRVASLVLQDLDDAAAAAAMADAVATPHDVTGAAHLPATGDAPARTVVRVQGMERQIGYRAERLARRLSRHGEVRRVDGEEHDRLWAAIRDCTGFADRPGAVWRLSMKPSDAAPAVEALRAALGAEALYDWAGGLVWLEVPEEGDAGAAAIRRETAARGGHATLVRASAATRASVQVFEPEPAPLRRIAEGLRARFDPAGILNPQRMGG